MTDRTETDKTDNDNMGEPFYKQSPKNGTTKDNFEQATNKPLQRESTGSENTSQSSSEPCSDAKRGQMLETEAKTLVSKSRPRSEGWGRNENVGLGALTSLLELQKSHSE